MCTDNVKQFWHRCVCSVFSKSIKCEMKLKLRRSKMFMRPLFFGHLWPRCYIPTFQGLEERQRKTTAVFSILHLSGKVSRLYIFFYFHCNNHVSLCWWWLRYCRLALYEVYYCYDLVCCAFGEKREKSFHVIVLHASPSHWWPFLQRVKVVWVSDFKLFPIGTSHLLSLFNSFCSKCVKHIGWFLISIQ